MPKRYLFLFCILLSSLNISIADEIRIATASNFTEPLKIIAQQFEQKTDHKVTIISGSTGKLYAQIKHGAPFDAFFSGDIKRAELLDKENVAIPNSRFTYAIGKLVLWSPIKNYIDQQEQTLQHKQFRYLAIANPKLAPYGKAAQEFLQKQHLWEQLKNRMVRGENISQTFQFVKSGNAELGLVAYSQIKKPNSPIEGSYWKIPKTFYTPVKQQAVLLNDKKPVHDFYDFVKSPESLNIIKSYGYSLDIKDSHAQ
ncbi:MAG: molybdate ABC transporter substrate-binding protein [Gammaproteobacteria bacterium]|nr:molybdate ABC transporter substrate-binding protein [Gammaproteobacteria bacterium]